MSGTKVHSNYEDLITFTRASAGHALRPVSYGAELVTNGDFSTDSDWTKGTGWTISGGKLVGTSVAAFTVAADEISLEVGKIYQIVFDVSAVTAGSVRCGFLGGTTLLATDNLTSAQTVTVNVIPNSGNNQIFIGSAGAGFTGSVESISVKEVTFDESDGTLTLFEHPDNIPRVEYDADGNRLGLLIEEQRTNLIQYSEEYDNASYWALSEMLPFGSGSTANATTAPNGTLTADLLVPNTTSSNSHFARQNKGGLTIGNNYTISVYVKAAGYTTCTLRMVGTNAPITNFDLSAGTTNQSAATITNVGNGWYRCTLTGEATSTTVWHYVYPNQQATFAGDGTSGIYVWGAQLEAGSFPTSYIKTTGSTATRSADVASIPVADFGYNQSEGTVFAEYTFVGLTPDGPIGYPRIWNMDQSPAGQYLSLMSNAAGPDIVRVDENSTETSSGATLIAGTTSKSAVAFKSSDVAISTDGNNTVTSSASWTLDLPTTIDLGSRAGFRYMTGHIKSIKYYPRRLTNAQLQDITS